MPVFIFSLFNKSCLSLSYLSPPYSHHQPSYTPVSRDSLLTKIELSSYLLQPGRQSKVTPAESHVYPYVQYCHLFKCPDLWILFNAACKNNFLVLKILTGLQWPLCTVITVFDMNSSMTEWNKETKYSRLSCREHLFVVFYSSDPLTSVFLWICLKLSVIFLIARSFVSNFQQYFKNLTRTWLTKLLR